MKTVIIIIVALLFIILMACLLAIPTVLLWNWLMPEIFSLPIITIQQAFGLNLLAGMFFRSSAVNLSDRFVND